MGTGGTDPLGLVLHWDGHRVQWCARSGPLVHKVGEWPARDEASLVQGLEVLKSQGDLVEWVVWGFRHPDFALAPGHVTEEEGAAVYRLQWGKGPAGVRVFGSEGWAAGWGLVEAQEAALEARVRGVWPQAVRRSAAAACLEAWGRESKGHGTCVYWDLSPGRALGSIWRSGQLRWALAVDAVEPDDLLYLTVNALHRQGASVEEARVGCSGEVAEGDGMWTGFHRFFGELVCIVPDSTLHRWEGEAELRLQRWWGLMNLGV